MTAPSTTDRGTPAGRFLPKGHKTKITFAANTTVSLWEKSVTPPGVDNGDEIDTTNMHNDDWQTKEPQDLNMLTEGSLTCLYDPNIYSTGQIQALVGVKTTITVTFWDGSQKAFYGYMKSFQPDEITPAEAPTATVTFMPTMWDPSANAEEGITVESVSGT